MSKDRGGHLVIDHFVAEIREIITAGHGSEPDLDALAARMRPLAADMTWITPALYETDADQGFGISILHEEGEDSFLLETVCWLPGRGVAPHDHQAPGLVKIGRAHV